jgi:hypothetical protein
VTAHRDPLRELPRGGPERLRSRPTHEADKGGEKIKFTGTGPGGRTVVGLGLSFTNLNRLKADQPIRVDLRELGLPGPPHEVVIFAGETEAVMTDRLYALGAIGPNTRVHGAEDESS